MSVVESANAVERFSFLENLLIPKTTAAGRYEVRFAANEEEVKAAQALRYRVFYQEKKGRPNCQMIAAQRDIDQWDESGFHVIVVDKDSTEQPKVMGTLRLFLNECLKPGQHFYTEETFNLTKLRSFYERTVEMSRFCIDSTGRGGVILMLIWKYTMSFLQDNDIDIMFGCASFSGTDADKHLPILNYLYEHHLAPESLRPVPKIKDYIDLKTIYKPDAEWSEAQKSIPTLLRGYIKLGAKISDAAIVDHAFNTVYVSIYVEAKKMFQKDQKLVMHV